jgi:hypothetical protein
MNINLEILFHSCMLIEIAWQIFSYDFHNAKVGDNAVNLWFAISLLENQNDHI